MDSVMDHAQIVTSTASPAFAVDTAGRILAWNLGAERLFGYPAPKVIGRLCWEAVQGQDLYGNLYCSAHCALIEMARHRQAIHGCDLLFRSAEDKKVRASVNSFIIPGLSPAEMAIVHFIRPVPSEETGETQRPDRNNDKARHPLLTERELQVLRLLARGAATREISRELRISTGTVRNHTGKILRSLQAHTRLQAVSTARALHLID